MKKTRQISESLELGILLALAGGFMDAYSYIQRGQVFANAQTGNILLLGVRLSQGEISIAFQYFIPILAFTIGIALSDLIRMKQSQKIHWRQITIGIEAFILLCVSFIPLNMNLIANSLTSFACGMQVESFRKIHGKIAATTMCIGNLRSGTESICSYFQTKNRHYLHNGLLYYGVILCFALGAVLGNYCIGLLHQYAIVVCVIILVITFMLMFIDRENL